MTEPAPAPTVTASPRKRRFHPLRWVAGLVVLVVLFGIVGTFVAPSIAKTKLEEVLSAELERTVRIGDVKLQPYTLSLALRNVVIEDRDGRPALLAFDALEVKGSWASITQRAPIISAVTMTKPRLNLARFADDRFNFTDILEKQAKKPKSDAPIPGFSINNIRLLDGHIEFDDQHEQTKHVVAQLELGVPFVSSLPHAVEITVDPKLVATVNGHPLDIEGHTKPFKDSLDTVVDLNFKNIELPRYVRYLPKGLGLNVKGGVLHTALHLEFIRTKDTPATLRLSGNVRVDSGDIRAADDIPLVDWKSLEVKLAEFSFPALTTTIDSITVVAPNVAVVRNQDGSVNFAKIGTNDAPTPTKSAATSPAAPFPLTIKVLTVSDGKVRWQDNATTPPFTTTLAPLALSLSNFQLDGKTPAAIKLTANTDSGSAIEHDGSLRATPLAIDGAFKLTGAKPQTYVPYFGHFLAVDVEAAGLDVQGRYQLAANATTNQNDLTLTELRLTGRDARVRERGTAGQKPSTAAEWLRIGSIVVEASDVNVSKQSVVIDSVALRDARVAVDRARDGKINWSAFVAPPTGPKPIAPSQPGAGTPPPWTWQLKKLGLANIFIQYSDRTPTEPVALGIGPLELTVAGLSSNSANPIQVALKSGLNKTGAVDVRGQVVIDPLSAALNVDAKTLEITPFQPYFEQFLNLVVSSGAVTTRGTVGLVTVPNEGVRAGFQGDVIVTDFASTDKLNATDLLKWKSLVLSEVKFASDPLVADIRDIALNDFFARVILSAAGRLNLQDLAVAKDPPAAAPASQTASPSPDLRLGKITVQNGNVNFSDFFVKPNYTANLVNVGGGVSELTPERAGDVLLRARIDNSGPVEVTGQINPLGKSLFLDMRADARDIDLPGLTPYAAKYVGYGIEKGKLSLKLEYKLENNKLNAENNIFLDQLTFGERIESPTATKLPVLLAVALLKDRNGVIDINLPISGSLEDPQFSIGGVIVRVLVNLLTKAVTSPFALLGSLFGGSDAELSFAEFEPGHAVVGAAAAQRLDTLVKALSDRPGLRMDVGGRVDPDADRLALRQLAAERAVRQQKFNELLRAGTPVPSVDAAIPTPEEYPRYLAAAVRALPASAQSAATGAAKPATATREELERRLADAVTISDEDLRDLANRRAQSAKEHLVNGGVAAERIFLVAAKMGGDKEQDKGRLSRVDFSLK